MSRALMSAVAAIALAPGTGAGYTLAKTTGGTPLRWPRMPVRFLVAQGGSRTLTAAEQGLEFAVIRRAYLAWEAVAGSTLRFEYGGRVPDAQIPERGDAASGVRFFSTSLPPELSDSIAVTNVVYDDDTGEIFDADVFLNERDYRFSTLGDGGAVDLESVVLHEAGHVAGLDHTCGAEGEVQPSCYDPALDRNPALRQRIFEAVMFPLRGVGDPPVRSLTADDAEGVSALYPASPPQPAPRPVSVSPIAGDGVVTLAVRGSAFEPGAAVRLFFDGAADVEARVETRRADEITAVADLAGQPPGCYDIVVRNPNGKTGVLFNAFAVRGARCRALLAAARGCACETASGGALAGLAAVAVALALRKRRSPA